jgi:integrase
LKAVLPLRPFRSVSGPVATLRDSVDLPHWTPHDFRRYFSSTMARLGTPIHITEQLLAHATGSRNAVQRIYDRYQYFDEMKAALEMYEAHILKITGST